VSKLFHARSLVLLVVYLPAMERNVSGT